MISGEQEDKLNIAAADTAKLCLFIDKLFDSVNSSSTSVLPGKELRGAVFSTSAHWKFWNEAIQILESMKFSSVSVPTIKNWVTTIKGFQYVCKKLLDSGFKFITLRSFNQDPVENLFCKIRSHGCRNTNPTCSNFQSSFKSLVINSLMSSQSVGANCENDNCENLTNFKKLLCSSSSLNSSKLPFVSSSIHTIENNNNQKTNSKLALACQSYVAGAVINKIKKLTKNCKFCLEILISKNYSKHKDIIKTRQYENCNLQCPSVISVNIYSIFINEFNSHIHTFITKPNIKLNFLNFVDSKIKFPSLCLSHNTKKLFLNHAFKILIFSYITNINRILKGDKIQNLCSEPDDIFILAANYYKHFKLKKQKILKNCNKNFV